MRDLEMAVRDKDLTMPVPSYRGALLLMGLFTLLTRSGAAWAGDRPQWGERFSRNMVSDETGLPATTSAR
jgi:hypothetical protein